MLSDIYFYDMYLWLMKVHVLRVVVDDVVRQQPRSGALSIERCALYHNATFQGFLLNSQQWHVNIENRNI